MGVGCWVLGVVLCSRVLSLVDVGSVRDLSVVALVVGLAWSFVVMWSGWLLLLFDVGNMQGLCVVAVEGWCMLGGHRYCVGC